MCVWSSELLKSGIAPLFLKRFIAVGESFVSSTSSILSLWFKGSLSIIGLAVSYLWLLIPLIIEDGATSGAGRGFTNSFSNSEEISSTGIESDKKDNFITSEHYNKYFAALKK